MKRSAGVAAAMFVTLFLAAPVPLAWRTFVGGIRPAPAPTFTEAPAAGRSAGG
jgi:hypothetical protein